MIPFSVTLRGLVRFLVVAPLVPLAKLAAAIKIAVLEELND